MIFLLSASASPIGNAIDLRTAGDLREAAIQLERLTQEEPTASAYIELGVTKSWKGDLSGAQRAYEQALRLDATNTTARVGYARVLGWRGRRRAARHVLGDLASTEANEVRRSVDDTRPAEWTLSGTAFAEGVRMESTFAYSATQTVTLRAGARIGRTATQPLADGWATSVGATFYRKGIWITPTIRWEDGPWVASTVAVRLGPCAPSLGAGTRLDGTVVRAQVGAQCEVGTLRFEGRVFTAMGVDPSEAVTASIGTNGTFAVGTQGVWLSRGRGSQLNLQLRHDRKPFGIGASLGYGQGALSGPAATLSVRLSR